jgi:hypothetical protein
MKQGEAAHPVGRLKKETTMRRKTETFKKEMTLIELILNNNL